MSVLYVYIGVKHFTDPNFFEQIMPHYLPFHTPLVYISGVFEIFFGCLLLLKNYRGLAGIGLILLLFAVFPANIYVYQFPEILCVKKSEALIRMFFQIPLILIAYWHSLENSPTWFSYLCVVTFIPTIVYFLTLEMGC